jgi:hypothetical protein
MTITIDTRDGPLEMTERQALQVLSCEITRQRMRVLLHALRGRIIRKCDPDAPVIDGQVLTDGTQK